MTSASLAPEGWIVGGVVRADPNLLEHATYWRGPLDATSSFSWDEIMSGTNQLATKTSSGFGGLIDGRGVLQSGVERRVAALVMVPRVVPRESRTVPARALALAS